MALIYAACRGTDGPIAWTPAAAVLQAYLGENPRAIVRWRQTATRAILQPYQLFPDCIIANSDVIFGRDRAHSMSFCRFFYTSWPDVVPAAPYCQTTLVIRMSTGSSDWRGHGI
jgi:hypothetical protein